jgi:methylated-DNA-[protein]-cysteine S-methyltransferase
VLALGFADTWSARMHGCLHAHGVQRLTAGPDARLASALRAYVAGEVRALDTVEVMQDGGAFHQRVWDALRKIPPGRTETYGVLARRLGLENGARAVGQAAAVNRVALIVPCHRLVGARGALTGFAHGIERKRWLLEHEGSLARQTELAGNVRGIC